MADPTPASCLTNCTVYRSPTNRANWYMPAEFVEVQPAKVLAAPATRHRFTAMPSMGASTPLVSVLSWLLSWYTVPWTDPELRDTVVVMHPWQPDPLPLRSPAPLAHTIMRADCVLYAAVVGQHTWGLGSFKFALVRVPILRNGVSTGYRKQTVDVAAPVLETTALDVAALPPTGRAVTAAAAPNLEMQDGPLTRAVPPLGLATSFGLMPMSVTM
mmetsp:Transcript_13199/g.39957  ORF Transcript_13199/g.39957 Transcript_13199/m.39957 type:complete len:215 (+) Transcript_13199:566-1210(+)